MSVQYCEVCEERPVYKVDGKGVAVCKVCATGGVTVITKRKKLGRNDQCLCGSGVKYKRCCGRKK